MSAVRTRITIESGKFGGKACIRGLRITVWDVLGWLGAGMTEEEILDEHPDLEKEDFRAVYRLASANNWSRPAWLSNFAGSNIGPRQLAIPYGPKSDNQSRS
jgi:uncharacterized protein (DUF433 family)